MMRAFLILIALPFLWEAVWNLDRNLWEEEKPLIGSVAGFVSGLFISLIMYRRKTSGG